MSDTLFGEHYFALRERLSGVVHGVTDLALVTKTPFGDPSPLEQLEKNLAAPFIFTVCGEINSGKSTLLNALFAREVCKTSQLPETTKVLRYQYGNVPRNVATAPSFEECYRPMKFLESFNLIDTPGTDSTTPGLIESTARALLAAELILVVFHVANPWSPATWNTVSALTPESLSRCIFIIQQADQREPSDLAVIREHMADLAMKRLGHTPPIFAVSAKNAFDARRSTPTAYLKLRASGFLELETFLSENICKSPTRKSLLDAYRRHAAATLRIVEDRIEHQSHTLNSQGRFLETIEREIDDIRERFVLRLPRHLENVAEVFETQATWTSKLLQKRLGVLSSFTRLFNGDRTGPRIESTFIARLQAAVESVAEQDGLEVVEFCRSHWEDLGERVLAAMDVDLGKSDRLDGILADSKKRFVQRLGRAARQGISNLKVRNQLDKDLRRRNVALKSFTFMTLLFTTAGATCGALEVDWLPAIFCGIALLFMTGGILVALATRKAIAEEFQKRLLDTCGSFANTLRSDYEEALRVFFQDYGTSLTAVRTHLAREKSAVEPRMQRWQSLFLTLKAIEQEL